MVLIGSVYGDDGLAIFLLKSKIKRHNFDGGFLVRHGLKPRSKIIMTDNAFMNYDAWFEVSKSIIKGYHQMPVIRDNPQWVILKFLDGFDSHKFDPRALELHANNHVLFAKEESKTLHVNQAYDQFVANNENNILA